MKDVYDPKAVEKKWQAEWQKRKSFAAADPQAAGGKARVWDGSWVITA